MSAAVEVLSDSSLSYDLLLKKSSDQCRRSEQLLDEASPSERADADEASTVEPETPCSASVIELESVASALPNVSSTVILRNVSHASPEKKLEGLIKQTRELSELVFDEDCLQSVTKKSHWKLSLLVSTDYSTLCGFAVTKVTNGALSIAKIAVPLEFRGLGFGKLLMEDAIKIAKKQGDVYEACLSSLSTAVTFYQRLGFKAHTAVKVKTDFEVVEGQVYMVKKLKPRPRGK
jgi:ribosomal protein S18 acetylase RimI-like enzyme